MPEKTGVIDQDSPPDNSKKSPSGGGKNGSSNDLESKIAELTDALKKKDTAIEELRGQLGETKEQMEARIEELLDKSRLTVSQENELQMLQRQKEELAKHQYGPALKETMKDVSRETMTELEKKIDFKDAKEWVEEKADELNQDPEKFEKQLVARFAGGRWPDKSLRQRVKLAWKEIQAEDSMKKDREEIEKKKVEFAENGGRLPPRGASHSSAVDLVKEGKLGDALDTIYNTQINEQRKLKGR